MYFVAPDAELSPLACAYARARGADRLSSFGDFISLSDVCDVPTARLIAKEVSDGVIAPGYEPEALEILKGKRKGNYNVIQIDESYVPAALERKMCYGVTFEQGRNALELNESLLANIVTENKELPAEAKRDLLIALIALKYTQSNSVCYVSGGQTIEMCIRDRRRVERTGRTIAGEYVLPHPQILYRKRQPDRIRHALRPLDVYRAPVRHRARRAHHPRTV